MPAKSANFDTLVWLYCSVFALSLSILFPWLQFGLIFRLWDIYNKPVDRNNCFCSCWDTVFKAGYETGVGSYKHVYFNATWNSLLIWALTASALILLYESSRSVFISLYQGRGRPRMGLLYLSVLYSHYYAWWGYFNAINDDFYSQIWHQTLFSMTEMISTLAVVYTVDARNPVKPRVILLIMSIALFHILASVWDQFAANVLRGEGQMHQVLRDLAFMAGDVLHLLLPWAELGQAARFRGARPSHLVKDRDMAAAAAGVAGLWVLSACL